MEMDSLVMRIYGRQKMNELNYCTQPLSRKLVENGIVLETEAEWRSFSFDFREAKLLQRTHLDAIYLLYGYKVPAPSFAELWRELPQDVDNADLEVFKTVDGKTKAGYYLISDEFDDGFEIVAFESTNPADALAELLIFVKGREKG
jgi:hypothetical protein